MIPAVPFCYVISQRNCRALHLASQPELLGVRKATAHAIHRFPKFPCYLVNFQILKRFERLGLVTHIPIQRFNGSTVLAYSASSSGTRIGRSKPEPTGSPLTPKREG